MIKYSAASFFALYVLLSPAISFSYGAFCQGPLAEITKGNLTYDSRGGSFQKGAYIDELGNPIPYEIANRFLRGDSWEGGEGSQELFIRHAKEGRHGGVWPFSRKSVARKLIQDGDIGGLAEIASHQWNIAQREFWISEIRNVEFSPEDAKTIKQKVLAEIEAEIENSDAKNKAVVRSHISLFENKHLFASLELKDLAKISLLYDKMAETFKDRFELLIANASPLDVQTAIDEIKRLHSLKGASSRVSFPGFVWVMGNNDTAISLLKPSQAGLLYAYRGDRPGPFKKGFMLKVAKDLKIEQKSFLSLLKLPMETDFDAEAMAMLEFAAQNSTEIFNPWQMAALRVAADIPKRGDSEVLRTAPSEFKKSLLDELFKSQLRSSDWNQQRNAHQKMRNFNFAGSPKLVDRLLLTGAFEDQISFDRLVQLNPLYLPKVVSERKRRTYDAKQLLDFFGNPAQPLRSQFWTGRAHRTLLPVLGILFPQITNHLKSGPLAGDPLRQVVSNWAKTFSYNEDYLTRHFLLEEQEPAKGATPGFYVNYANIEKLLEYKRNPGKASLGEFAKLNSEVIVSLFMGINSSQSSTQAEQTVAHFYILSHLMRIQDASIFEFYHTQLRLMMSKESLTIEELAQIWFFKIFAAEFGVELLDSFLTLYSKIEAKYSERFAGAIDPRNLIDSRLLNHSKPWMRPLDINDPAPQLH